MSPEGAPVVERHTHTVERIRTVGLSLLRYGLVFLLVTIGSFKFFAFEAEAIRPLVSNSPFLAWLYEMLGIRGTAAMFGVFEVIVGALVAARHWAPRVSGYASLAASSMFLATLSFLLTTPGALAPTSPVNQFLLKDIVLLGAALFTAAEALAAGSERTSWSGA
jgi:uncharacterized membrane protein YkgB